MPFELTSRSPRLIRWVARAPRLALVGTCAVLCAAGLRAITDRPPAQRPLTATPRAVEGSAGEEAVAEAFARAYLSWDAAAPTRHIDAVARYAPGIADELRGDPHPTPSGRQDVRWSAVAGDERAAGGARRITVFAETSNGPTALAVTVRRDRSGSVYVDGFPAIVGTPPVARAGVARTREPIDNTELAATASRAVRNYVAARRDALAADLLPGALAVVPDVAMRATTIEEMTWSLPGRAIDVVVRARLSTGGELALAYELGVVRQASRWFVRWIETQPRED